ncbi:MAG: hypothetical protein ACYDDO_11440 [Acidiferrobacterales bacterium]
MYRRLYFILSDETCALQVMQDIEAAGVAHDHIHAMPGKGINLNQLPPATPRQQHNVVGRIERIVWGTNLGIFFVALVGLIQGLVRGSIIWSAVSLLIIIAAIAGGALFAVLVPDVHLGEFRGALSHGDIVLLVDVPKSRVREIEEIVEQRHPDATAGGVSWTINALGV